MISADNLTGDNRFKLISGNRLELLALDLSKRFGGGDIFTPEIIVVQSRGMERWLSLRLAEFNGIAANLQFPFPKAFISNHVFSAISPDICERDVFPSPEISVWKICGLLPSLIESDRDFAQLRNYIADDHSGLKLFQLAEQLAKLFDNYLVFRPDVIREWDKRKNPLAAFPESKWQMKLWHGLSAGNRPVHFASMYAAFLKLIYPDLYPECGGMDYPADCGAFELPPRIFFFGFTSLSPAFMDMIFAVSKITEVYFYYLNPCREQAWEYDLTRKQEMHLISRELKNLVEKSDLKDDFVKQELEDRLSDLYIVKGNSLLGSLGTQGREFFGLINSLNEEGGETLFDENPATDTLLHKIQRDIQELRNPANENNPDEALIDDGDRSIQIHSCHSPMREVEALFENLIDMFDRDASLLPKDVMVLVPEIEKYAPYIEAVFNSRQYEDPQWFFATIADRRRSCSDAETTAFIGILNLCSGRFKAPDLLDILENPAVSDRFGIDEDKLPLVRQWICDANISWGIDREFREQTVGTAFYENSWRFGLARMQAGFAMGGNQAGDEAIFTGGYSGDILPCGGFSEQNAELLGRFVEFMELLFEMFHEIKNPKPDSYGNQVFTAPWWKRFLLGIINNFFSGKTCFAEPVQDLREAANTVTGNMEKGGLQAQAGLEVMIYALKSSLDSTSVSGGFLRGGVTFCEARPLRSIPSRVICMLGMDENSFPRRTGSASFDLMAARPRFGDRSARNDDRFLFLESLISARDVFYVSYTGQGNKDNTEYPPSVLVSELLDYIASGYRFARNASPGNNREDVEKRLKIKHPLQAFSWRYFAEDPDAVNAVRPVAPLVSYSRENLHAAEMLFLPRARKIFLEKELEAPPEELLRINLADLVAFFRNPAKYFLTKRLMIRPSIEDVPEIAECEKFELNGLDKYKIAEKMLRDNIATWRDDGREILRERLKRHYRASGALSPGSWGEQQFESLFLETAAFAEKLAPHVREKIEPLTAGISFANGVSMFVRLENIYSNEKHLPGQMLFRYASLKDADMIRAAIFNLAANLEQIREIAEAPLGTLLIGKDKFCFYAAESTETAAEKIQSLLDIFIRGLRKPLPFFPATSAAYYRAVMKGDDRKKALDAAVKKWESDFAADAESKDDYFKFFYKLEFPAGEEFEQTAMLIGDLLQLDKAAFDNDRLEKEGSDA